MNLQKWKETIKEEAGLTETFDMRIELMRKDLGDLQSEYNVYASMSGRLTKRERREKEALERRINAMYRRIKRAEGR